MIDEILAYNKQFVEEKGYEKYATSKYPNKKIAILTCMDTRLVELLPAALGLKNGDVKIIKNAGGVVTNPFGSVIRSLLVAIIELGVEEIMVIGHTDCGVQHIDSDMMIRHMKQRGITQESIDLMKYCGITDEEQLDNLLDSSKRQILKRGLSDVAAHWIASRINPELLSLRIVEDLGEPEEELVQKPEVMEKPAYIFKKNDSIGVGGIILIVVLTIIILSIF